MSLIKDALDKAVAEDKKEKSAKEHYKELEGRDEQGELDGDSESEKTNQATTSGEAEPEDFQIPTRYILLLTAMIVLTVVVLGQVVFLLTYFL